MARPKRRRRCDLCGNELPPKEPGPGRPSQYCAPDTGRPCREWVKRYEALRRMGDEILEHSPSATRERARSGLRRKLGTAREELLAGET